VELNSYHEERIRAGIIC